MSSEADLKTADRALWAAGDYDAIAELSWEVGEVVAGAVPIEAGMKVLDIGTGTGSAAIRAAQAGATVIGLDIAPELFEAARRRAAEAGVEVEWVEADAEALPYEDDSFDRVLSAFGAAFAGDSNLAANEIVRVCRPGGEIVLANWSADGFGGRLSDLLRSYGEHTGAVAASQWGTFGHVRRTLGGQLVLAIEPHSVDLAFESVDAMLGYFEENLGPLVVARAQLERGSYGALRGQLRALIEELDVGEGETRVPAAYKLVIGHKPVAM
jgi:SAM-dependent methyltransferase